MVENVAFICVAFLLCLIKKEMVLGSRMERSEQVGWSFELKMDVSVSSGHQRKPKKPRMNMVWCVHVVWSEW